MINTEALYSAFLNSSGVCTDSRTLGPDQIFFALRGDSFDGNDFVETALNLDCRLVVCEDVRWEGNSRVAVVPSALESLQALSRHHRRAKKIIVLAITGSNGKTTTKELIHRVLSSELKTMCTRGNLNNHIGVPLTLLTIKEEEVAIIEMGANHPGEIAALCAIAEPDLGIITNVGKAHLEGFGSVEGVRKAKGELYKFLDSRKKKIILHANDPVLICLAGDLAMDAVTYGCEGRADVIGTLSGSDPFVYGVVRIDEMDFHLSTSMVGRYNFLNILAALATGKYFGISTAGMIAAVASYEPDNNRSQLLSGKSNSLILDAYNANPTSMRAALEDFVHGSHQRKMVILGDMLELGDAAPEEHRNVLKLLKESNLEEVILVGKIFFSFSKDPDFPFHFFQDTMDCMTYLEENRPSGFHILLKGSRRIALEKATNLLLSC